MLLAIAKKYAKAGAKIKLLIVVGTQVGPASATKGMKKRVVGLFTAKTRDWSGVVKITSRHPINEIDGSQESFVPKTNRERRVSEKSNGHRDDVPVFSIGDAVLLRRVRTGGTMLDACTIEIPRETAIFSTPVRLDGADFGLKQPFHMRLKVIKGFLHI